VTSNRRLSQVHCWTCKMTYSSFVNNNFNPLYLSNKRYAQFEIFRGWMFDDIQSFTTKIVSKLEVHETGDFCGHSLNITFNHFFPFGVCQKISNFQFFIFLFFFFLINLSSLVIRSMFYVFFFLNKKNKFEYIYTHIYIYILEFVFCWGRKKRKTCYVLSPLHNARQQAIKTEIVSILCFYWRIFSVLRIYWWMVSIPYFYCLLPSIVQRALRAKTNLSMGKRENINCT